MSNLVHNGLSFVTLNWRPAPRDHRDYQIGEHLPHVARLLTTPSAIPSRASLAQFNHSILDQTVEGACTAHGTLGSVYNLAKQRGIVLPELSRQAQYNWSRMLEGTLGTDAGAYIRDAAKVTSQFGMAREELFQYGPQNLTVQPMQNVVTDALTRKTLKYVSVPNDGYSIKAMIASGFTVIVGFSVPQNFMTAQVAASGIIPMPSGSIIGGHCIFIDGYDDSTSYLEGPNSWGTAWGMTGRLKMPYQFLQQLGSDFWAITDMQGTPVPPPPPVPAGTYTYGGFSIPVTCADGVVRKIIVPGGTLS